MDMFRSEEMQLMQVRGVHLDLGSKKFASCPPICELIARVACS